ncbi:uncharacterized protein LOC128185925 isoform X1 [Crassostrea angulata]|uniref:uncharacterized protein LOC128185925 isoform X1 n=1 Tax=Magallana angulata TaxID=2784310 RepID=UPI0022B0D976|nr:uncharacterized protein LOC128185925 isoform X1 [Crassostrea angulata]
MKMSLIHVSVIIFACLTLMVSASISMMCPESIPTVSIVPRCPSDAMEWKLAAERKKCDVLGKIQNCTEEDKFMYHCVLNRDATMLLEVCAPMHYMSGYCARFSELHKRIINDPALDCAKFDPPCPTRFQSNESYKYQACYSIIPKLINSSPAYHHQENQTEKDTSTDAIIVNTFLAIFVIITVALIILLLVGYKLHWIEFNRDGKPEERTAEEEGFLVGNSEHIKDQTDENDEEMKISNLDVELSKATEENEVVKKEHMDKERDMDEINTEEGEKDEKKEIEDAERNKEAFIVNDVHNKEFERESRRPTTPEFSNFREENKQFENEKDKFEYFWQKESVFSQWYPSKFVVDGVEYSCAEQYMMQQKAILMDDMETADIIMALDAPIEMKQYGRYVKNFSQTLWDQHCTRIVEKGNIAKFSQNDDLKMTLFSTYPKTLVEASPYDKVWGIGLRQNDRRAWNKSTWLGKNLLGEILTRVRDKLREEM